MRRREGINRTKIERSPSIQHCYVEDFIVGIELGLHLRSAALFVMTASRYQADVTVACRGRTVSGKNLLALLLLDAEEGSSLRITTCGLDAFDAMSALGSVLGQYQRDAQTKSGGHHGASTGNERAAFC